jgi:hypothetical protein
MYLIAMKKYLLLITALLTLQTAQAQFTVSANQHYILKDGKPFFWMGDTAWELFAKLTREEADTYLKTRASQGFTVIQAAAAGLDEVSNINVYGDMPLIDRDPNKPNEKYFEHVDYVINKAEQYHLNIVFLPSWASGPQGYTEQNAAVYGAWLAKRYKNKTNLIWMLGGDKAPQSKDVAIWRAMGEAIMKGTNDKALISYHSAPNRLGSAEWFRNEGWFAFNSFQNGHCRDEPVYDKMLASYNALPAKPEIDAEPIYEDHPVCFNVKDLGTSSPYDVRKYAYLDLFAGAFGHTYGCHDVWQMYSPKMPGINGPHFYWYDALELPGANQMQYVRRLMESHPYLDRVPDQSVILENNNPPAERIQATRGSDYIFVYTAAGKPFTVDPTKIKVSHLKACWYNPRDGKVTAIDLNKISDYKFYPPSRGYGQDWVLVLDDADKGYKL